MVRTIRLLAIFLPLLFASCVATEFNPPQDEIEDIRLDIERCPVHDELLIENLQSVDWERGQYVGPYYEIRAALFPCAYDDAHSMSELALVTYCPKCRFAKAKYLSDKNEPSLPEEFYFVKDNEELRKQWRQDVDAFIARHRRELEQEYGTGGAP